MKKAFLLTERNGKNCSYSVYSKSLPIYSSTTSKSSPSTLWASFSATIKLYPLDKHFTYLPIVELYRDYEHNTEQFSKSALFGGKSEDALKANMWIPASDPIALDLDNDENKDGITIEYKYGDTWYQRFDCLKTYAYTLED